MVANFFGNLFSIKPNEWESVLYFFLVLLIFSFGASFARSIGMVLLIGKLGGDKLPVMYILTDLAVMIGSIGYANYSNKFSGLSIFKFFLLSTTLFAIIVQILFLFIDYWWEGQTWVYGFFFVGFAFFFIIISIHSGSVIASYFTAIQAKRVIPIINTGIPIGGVLGGSCLFILLSIFEIKPQYLVTILSISCFGAFLLLGIINNNLSPVRVGETQIRGSRNPFSELIGAFKYTLSSKLMIFMSIGLVLFVIAQKLLEYQYQTVIYFNHYPNDTERTAFFASYEIFANLVSLFLQLFLTSRIVMKIGVGYSNIVHPLLSAIIAFALVTYFYDKTGLDSQSMLMLGLGIVAQFINQEMRWALRTPTNNLLFNAIPPGLWASNKAFLNGIIFPLSTFIASFLLIFITANPISLGIEIYQLLPIIIFFISLLAIVVAIPQSTAYNHDMFETLNRKLFDSQYDQLHTKPSNSFKKMIQKKLGSTDSHHVIVALEMIRIVKLNDFLNQVGNLLLKIPSFEIKRYCISTLSALPQSQSNLTYLVEALHTEKDANVLPLILKNLSEFKSVNLNDTIEKLLTHPSPSVFVEASLCLYNHPKYQRKNLIEQKILERLKTTKLHDLKLYLYALGELQQASYSQIILPFLKHENAKIRVAAFVAFVRMLKNDLEEHKPRFITALDSKDKGIKVAALKALKKCKPLKNWSSIIKLLAEKDRTVVAESRELLRLSLNICKADLIQCLFYNIVTVQQRFEILSLVYLKLNDEQFHALQKQAEDAFKKFIWVNGLLKLHESLSNQHPNRTNDLVAKILKEIAENHLLHVLTVITFASEQNIEFFRRVNTGLLSPNRANQGNALEVLSNVREKYLADCVLKYFEERTTDLKTLKNIYFTLFHTPLDLTEQDYEISLLNLNHDMLKACLLYRDKKKKYQFLTGKLPKNVIQFLK